MKCGKNRGYHEITTKSTYWKNKSFATCAFDIDSTLKSQYPIFIILIYFHIFFTVSNFVYSIQKLFITAFGPLIFQIFIPNSQLTARHLRILFFVFLQAAAFTSSEAFIIPQVTHKENQHSSSASTIAPFRQSNFIHNPESGGGGKLLNQLQTITPSNRFASETSNKKSAGKMLLTNLLNKELHEALSNKEVGIIERRLSTKYPNYHLYHTSNDLDDSTTSLEESYLLSNIFQYRHFQTKESSPDFDTHSGIGVSSREHLPVIDSSTAFPRRRKRKELLISETVEFVTHDKSVPLLEEFQARHDWLYQRQQNEQVGRPLDLVNHFGRHEFGDHIYRTQTKSFNVSSHGYTQPESCKNVLLREKQSKSANSVFHAHGIVSFKEFEVKNKPKRQSVSDFSQKTLDHLKPHSNTKSLTSSQGKNLSNPNKNLIEHDEWKNKMRLVDFKAYLLGQSGSKSGAGLASQKKEIKLFSKITFPAYGANSAANLGIDDDNDSSRESRARTDSWKLETKRAKKSEFSITLLHKTFIMQEKEKKQGFNDNLKNSNRTVSRSNYHMFATPQETVYAHLDVTTAYNSDAPTVAKEDDDDDDAEKAKADQEDYSRHAPENSFRAGGTVPSSNKRGDITERKVGSLESQGSGTVAVAGGSTFASRDDFVSTKQAVVFVVDSKPVVKGRVNSGKIDHTIKMLAGKVLRLSQQEHRRRRQPQLTSLSHTEAAYQNQEKSFVRISSSISREQKIQEPRAGSVSEREQIFEFYSQTKQSNSESDDDNGSIFPVSIKTALTKDDYSYQPTIADDTVNEVSAEAKQRLTEIDGDRGKEGNGGHHHQLSSIQTQSRAKRDVDGSSKGDTTQTPTNRPPAFQQTTAAKQPDQQIHPVLSSQLSTASEKLVGQESLSREDPHKKPEKAATTTGNESTSGRFIILAFLAIILLLLIITALSLRCYTKLRKRRLEKDLEKKTAQAAFAASSDLGSVVKKNYTAYESTTISTRQRERRNASIMDSKNEVEKDPQEKTCLLQSFDTGSGSVEDRRKSDDNHQSNVPKSSVTNVPTQMTSSSENVLQVADYRIKKAGSFSCEPSHPLEMWRRASLMSQSSRRRGSYMFVHKDSLSSLNMLGVTNMPNNYPMTAVSTSLCTTTAASNMNNLQTSTEHQSSSSFSVSPNPSPSPNKTVSQMTAVPAADMGRATTPLSMNTLTAPTIFEISCSNPDLTEDAPGSSGGPKPTLIYQPEPIKESLREPGNENYLNDCSYNHKLLKRSRSASKHNALPKDKTQQSERRRNSGPGRCDKGLLTPVQQRNLRNSYAMRFYSYNSLHGNNSNSKEFNFDGKGYLNKYKKTRQKVRMGTCVCQTCIRYLKMDCEGSLKEDLYNQISGVPYLLYKIDAPMYQNHYTLKPINLNGIFNEAKSFCDIRFESYHTTASAFYPHKIRLHQARNHHFSVIPRHTLHSFSSRIQTSI